MAVDLIYPLGLFFVALFCYHGTALCDMSTHGTSVYGIVPCGTAIDDDTALALNKPSIILHTLVSGNQR